MAHTHRIHLDHASASPVSPHVLGAMMPFFANHFASPAAPFSAGHRPREALGRARSQVASFICAHASEIVFTSSAHEANILAASGTVRLRGKGVVLSDGESPSATHCLALCAAPDIEVRRIETGPEGTLAPEALFDLIRDDMVLVSVNHASSATGVIRNVRRMAEIARSRGSLFHCDCTQTAGKIPIDVDELGVDLLTVSSPQLGGPRGIGALYVRTGAWQAPLSAAFPPSSVDCDLIALNTPAAVGFGMACENAHENLEANTAAMKHLRDLLERELSSRLEGVTINGAGLDRVCHITSITFDGVDAACLAAWLDLEGITVSFLCPLPLPHHGRPWATGTGSWPGVRFSTGIGTTEEDIATACHVVEKAVRRLRAFSDLAQGAEVSVFTFPTPAALRHCLRALEGESIPCAVIALRGKAPWQARWSQGVSVLRSHQDSVMRIVEDLGVHPAEVLQIEGIHAGHFRDTVS